ncbi:hypothetical protein B7S03_06885, partial [Listeria monocytogenes]|nr:hypothetical protein [Listeria monocytogenes]
LAQYIREFGSQVDSSPSARIDAEILQEAMAKVASLKRKEEDLHRQLTAPNTKPDMQQVYVVQARSAHTQLLQAIEKEDILERYIAFEQSHSQFFSALVELIHSTGRAVQELKQNVTFHEKTGTYTVAKSVHASISLMRKSMDKARKENAKDPFPEAFEDYQLFAYTYVNDKGETVTMWLLEQDGKRASNKELQAFLEENGAELDPILYTNLSGEDLERKVNDAWKDGVNYLNGQKVTGFSRETLRSSAYVASMKDAMDDAGLTDMALGLGFGIAAARNKAVIPKKQDDLKVSNFNKEQILKNIEASKKAREASNFSEYLKREKELLKQIKKANGAKVNELKPNEINNMSLNDLRNSIPEGWKFFENNGRVHIKDTSGQMRIRIDPPDKITKYQHMHIYDDLGNPLDKLGNIVDRTSLDGHLPWNDK